MFSCAHDWIRGIYITRAISTVLSRVEAVATLSSVATGEGQGQFSHFLDPRINFPACIRWFGGEKQGARGEKGHLSLTRATT